MTPTVFGAVLRRASVPHAEKHAEWEAMWETALRSTAEDEGRICPQVGPRAVSLNWGKKSASHDRGMVMRFSSSVRGLSGCFCEQVRSCR